MAMATGRIAMLYGARVGTSGHSRGGVTAAVGWRSLAAKNRGLRRDSSGGKSFARWLAWVVPVGLLS
ncbi:putative phospholipid binding protein [Sesbania bispinosa]|nr:putative phospholipid binding protein [Sesbania bispinosa]KAJ1386460.1 putative phospholipid binding protein [Sesbania bispinosa]